LHLHLPQRPPVVAAANANATGYTPFE